MNTTTHHQEQHRKTTTATAPAAPPAVPHATPIRPEGGTPAERHEAPATWDADTGTTYLELGGAA